MASNREIYKVKDSKDTAEVNRVLQRIADALDQLAGLRGVVTVAAGMTVKGPVTVVGSLTVKGTINAGGDETTT